MTYAAYPYGAFPFGGLGADELGQELTIEERIEATLFRYAAIITTEADPTKVWPNSTYTPSALYLRIDHMPNRNERLYLKGTNPHLRQGILQITVVSPLNVGPTVATRVAGQVAENFPAELKLYDYGVLLTIQEAPSVGQAFPNDATWVVPVSIRYYVFA
jgi:hypothetical protein